MSEEHKKGIKPEDGLYDILCEALEKKKQKKDEDLAPAEASQALEETFSFAKLFYGAILPFTTSLISNRWSFLPGGKISDTDSIDYLESVANRHEYKHSEANPAKNVKNMAEILKARQKAVAWSLVFGIVGYAAMEMASENFSKFAGFSNTVGLGKAANTSSPVVVAILLALAVISAGAVLSRSIVQGAYSAKYMPEVEGMYWEYWGDKVNPKHPAPEVDALNRTRWFFKGLWQGLTNQHPNFKTVEEHQKPAGSNSSTSNSSTSNSSDSSSTDDETSDNYDSIAHLLRSAQRGAHDRENSKHSRSTYHNSISIIEAESHVTGQAPRHP